MANIETIGVRAVAENVDKAISDLNRLNKAVGSVGSQAVATASPLGVLGGALSNVAQIAAGIISAQLINRMVEGLKDLASQAILGAGRVDELEVILELLGTRAGYATDQLYQWRDAIKDAGIRTDVATELLAQFIRYQIDASEAVKLAAVAQNAATFAGEDSTQALAGLLDGILKQNVLILRNYNIMVDMSQAYENYKVQIGAVGRELTANERVQAALNAVLKEGASIAGAYAAAMETPSKMLRTLSGRLIPEMIWAMGEPFQTAFHDAVFAISDFVKGLSVAVSEGGRLRPIIDALAAAANRLLAPIVALAGVASQWLGTVAEGAAQVASKIEGVSAKIAAVKPPDLAAAFADEAKKIADVNRDLTKSIARMWEDHNRRLVQSVFDFNLGRLRDELDWQRQQARDLAEHNRKMAEMYLELEELKTGKRRQEIKAGMAAERKDYEGQRAQLVALLGQAQSEEEKLRVQGWVNALDAEHQANQDAAQEELNAIDAEQAALEKRIAMEEQAFQRSRDLADEDRRIKLQREDEDFARRLARDEEEVGRREALQREEAAERIALVQEGIAAERAAKAAAYAEQTAALSTSVETQKAIMKDAAKGQMTLVDEWKETIQGLVDALAAIDWAVFSENMVNVATSLDELNETLGKLVINFDRSGATLDNLGKPFEGLRLAIEGNMKWLSAWVGVVVTSIDIVLTLLSEGPMAAARKLPELLGYLTDAIMGFVQVLASIPYTIVESVLGGIDAFYVLFRGEEPHLKRDFQNWAQGIADSFMQGFTDGVNRGWQAVIDRIRGLAEAIVYEIKLRLDMFSPSKLFFAMGQEIPRSLAEGIRSMGDLPAMQMGNVALGTLAAVPASTTNVSQEFNWNVSSLAPVSTLAQDYHLVRTMAGG